MQTVSRASATNGVNDSKGTLVAEIANQVFDSLRWTQVNGGKVEDVFCLDNWMHRTPKDIEADLAYLEINRAEVLSALSKYLADASSKTSELDWLFLNVLTYAEYIATVSEIRKSFLGVDGYINTLHPPKATHTACISDVAARPWRTVTAVGITAIAAFVHPLLALGIGSVSIYQHMKRKKGVAQINRVLEAMLRTYLSCNTVDLSWSQVAATLDESRRVGALWDASLFRLAEVRQIAAQFGNNSDAAR